MRLYILGPAFGLPSIDANCIAAVALVKAHCESTGEPWELIVNYEPVLDSQLPLLQHNAASFSGFSAIARYVADTSGSILGSPGDLSLEQRAEATASVLSTATASRRS